MTQEQQLDHVRLKTTCLTFAKNQTGKVDIQQHLISSRLQLMKRQRLEIDVRTTLQSGLQRKASLNDCNTG